MIYMKYLRYVLLHKWYVMLECFKRGLYWRGIVHDLSKFRPSEFIPYARHFGRNPPDTSGKTGYCKPTDTGDRTFEQAWFLHLKRNRHHWQYWVLPTDTGYELLPVPLRDLQEMLCDWIGAGKAQRATGAIDWYEKNGRRIQLHSSARAVLEDLLRELNERKKG